MARSKSNPPGVSPVPSKTGSVSAASPADGKEKPSGVRSFFSEGPDTLPEGEPAGSFFFFHFAVRYR